MRKGKRHVNLKKPHETKQQMYKIQTILQKF